VSALPVSVVIAARDAAATLGEALDSLRAQTLRDWEAIVVDDGSTDATAAVAEEFSAHDPRVRVIRRSASGVSAARNAGIREARFDWLVFLDADDWLFPQHLQRMTEVLAREGGLDGVHCGWRRVTAAGEAIEEAFCPFAGDLFSAFAVTCVFAIHACIVRRARVEAAGGFDPALTTCEDWDLWQRVARSGARFGRIAEVQCGYRLRPTSATADLERLLADGLRTIALGHASDPRVRNPAPEHAAGRPAEELGAARLHYVCWMAGLVLGRGEDPRPLLDVAGTSDPGLDPALVADDLLKGVAIARCEPLSLWAEAWPDLDPRVRAFLSALEDRSGAPGLSRRASVLLEQRVAEHAPGRAPRTLGTTHAVHVEITEPSADVFAPPSAERLHCAVLMEGKRLGTLVLPLFRGRMPAPVLADAIAARFAWVILGRFFEHGVYRRGDLPPAGTGASVEEGEARTAAHDRVGWSVFLQELWGRPGWPESAFYDPAAVDDSDAAVHDAGSGRFVFEVSHDATGVRTVEPAVHVAATVGGAAVGIVAVPALAGSVRAQALRSAVNHALGFELCRAVVREGLLGLPLSDPTPLRARLAAAAARAAPQEERRDAQHGLVLGRRPHHPVGTSASRRAVLPTEVADELRELASVTGQPVLEPVGPISPTWVEYVPEVLPRSNDFEIEGERANASEARSVSGSRPDRAYFESLFAGCQDPWRYETDYERTKYRETISLLPSTTIGHALEVGCAEGHFTAQLAPRVGSLLAVDLSAVALARAARRCAALGNVRFEQLDVVGDSLPRGLDLIVCSEVLYYVGGMDGLRSVARKLADALAPGGLLVTAHANLVVDEPDRAGFAWDLPFGAKVIGEVLEATWPLRRVREIRTPLYRIVLFRREPRRWLRWRRPAPEVVERPLASPPHADAAARILWRGGDPCRETSSAAQVTHRLPILLYHRVAPTGSSRMARYRVTPDAFEEQLDYLRDAGFRSVTLDEWRIAAALRRPLPGRAVIITFDDGYADFRSHAWPLLRRYEFSACVFLVADRVGGTNDWDEAYGEVVPLLQWPEVRELRSEGIEFGSHAATHRPLTSLTLEEATREAIRSLRSLTEGLGAPVRAIAYPHGDADGAIRHLVGACGYLYGLTCRPGACAFGDDLLDLPRIEVTGHDRLQHFVEKIAGIM
jgi:peptidoglycan/xylan/chitin deacetylase (PgdA/CDA1 family)/2-polyprenyl-3-methyl-5-hydroxy-6-metoxy-1,4-benzoquinol methylase